MKFLTPHETLDYLIRSECSMARFGDGENGFLVRNKGVPTMQDFSVGLKNLLHNVLFLPPPGNFLVCVHNEATYNYVPDRVYGNSFVTRPTHTHLATDDYFNKFKMLWQDKEVVVVNFYPGIIDSYMFDNVRNIAFFSIPMRHCWSKHKDIMSFCKEHFGQNKVFLLSCGITATVLSAKIALLGERVLDIGKICFEWAKYSGESEEKLIAFLSQDKLAPKHKNWRQK
jgi:hypothetical protein